MGKKIIIGSMLVLTLLLLIPSISNVSAYDVIDEIDFGFIRGRYNTIEKNEDGYKITCDRRNMVVKGIDEYMIFWYPEFRFYFTRNFIEIHIHRFFGIITPNFMIGIVHNLY